MACVGRSPVKVQAFTNHYYARIIVPSFVLSPPNPSHRVTSITTQGTTFAVSGVTTDLGASGVVTSPASCVRSGAPSISSSTVTQAWTCRVPSVGNGAASMTTLSVFVADAFSAGTGSVQVNTTISAATPAVPFSVALKVSSPASLLLLFQNCHLLVIHVTTITIVCLHTG